MTIAPPSRVVVLLVLSMAAACGGATRPSTPRPAVDTTPTAIGDGWTLSTAAAQGLDAAQLASLSSAVAAGQYGQVDSVVIARHGALCFDASYNGTPLDVHEMQSVTKSVTSALVGAAIARGAIGGVQQPVAALLPEFAAAAQSDPAKANIRLEHLLTMTAGLDWDETNFPNGDARNTLSVMNASADWVGYVVSRRAAETPGARFNYNSGGVILLGAILRAATAQDVVAFATDALFAPMGIRSLSWTRNPAHPEQVHTGGGLALRARDAAKIGQLFLDDGLWKGERLLPASWVRESVQPRIGAWDGAQYGYLWWLRNAARGAGVSEAWGTRGQHVFVVAAADLVVVVTARDNQIDGGRRILDAVLAALP